MHFSPCLPMKVSWSVLYGLSIENIPEIILVLLACQSKIPLKYYLYLAAVRGQIRQRARKWVEMYEANDVSALVSEMYTEDCKVSMPGSDMVIGQTGQ